MSSSDFANVYASINNLQNQFDEITGNTLSNYNQLSRIVAQQSNIYNTIYFGSGNISTGFLSVSNNANITGNMNIKGNVDNLKVSGNIVLNNGNLSLTTGNLIMSNGNLSLTTGNLIMSNGNLSLTTGNLIMSNGNLSLTTGNVIMSNGNLSLTTGNVIMSNGNLIMSNGNLRVTTGNLIMTNGNLSLTTGNLLMSNGNLSLTTGNMIMSNGNLSLTTGNLIMTNGNLSLTTGNLLMSNGNIGLGTSSPTSTLHVVGNARITSNVYIGPTVPTNLQTGVSLAVRNTSIIDSNITGSLSGNVYHQLSFGSRNWVFSQDTSNDNNMLLGCQGGGDPDPDFEYIFKRTVGLQIQPNPSVITTDFTEALKVIGTANITGNLFSDTGYIPLCRASISFRYTSPNTITLYSNNCSVTRNSQASYTITFINPPNSTDYTVSGFACITPIPTSVTQAYGGVSLIMMAPFKTTTQCLIWTSDGNTDTGFDPTNVCELSFFW